MEPIDKQQVSESGGIVRPKRGDLKQGTSIPQLLPQVA